MQQLQPGPLGGKAWPHIWRQGGAASNLRASLAWRLCSPLKPAGLKHPQEPAAGGIPVVTDHLVQDQKGREPGIRLGTVPRE